MVYTSKPQQVGIGIGGIGVGFSFLVTALVFLIPHYLLPTATAQHYLETWMTPILSVATPIEQYGIPLLAALAAFYLVSSREYSARDVMVGFLVGGLVLGVGVALLNWGVTHPSARVTVVTYGLGALQRAGFFAGAALLGVVSGEASMRHADGSSNS